GLPNCRDRTIFGATLVLSRAVLAGPNSKEARIAVMITGDAPTRLPIIACSAGFLKVAMLFPRKGEVPDPYCAVIGAGRQSLSIPAPRCGVDVSLVPAQHQLLASGRSIPDSHRLIGAGGQQIADRVPRDAA